MTPIVRIKDCPKLTLDCALYCHLGSIVEDTARKSQPIIEIAQ
jgi:hypothetical protein